ncbi:chromosomal replication initiator protein DnaA [Corynebacterium epidermidicanis]|uniref:Chromosomal replication initiator protein DnaA n=1 Tax=Corynebacterium epidermidicanis TaxID=1050174 RepID=A0A0G3GL67_9CORY|nr:chromosomal replication initiator protein DnaA [Corynebacterium epidermidicanis]
MAKEVVENELAEPIEQVLQSMLGAHTRLAVSVAPTETLPAASSPQPVVEKLPDDWAEVHIPVAEEPEPPAPVTPVAPEPQRIAREQRNPRSDVTLNPRYTFENFVIGGSNRFPHAAAVAVAESLATAYNPLFIWGGSGLGKTHLLHAIGNYAQVLQPGLRVRYVSSEEFTNDYINSVRDDRQEKFKQRYRNLDILMVDDIQFLEGKEGTQEEFFHTFNALHQADKQIVLSSDRSPNDLSILTDRLLTRFKAGLIVDIQPPDLETRIAILSKKAKLDGTVVQHDVLELIASRFDTSIRELEGALIRVIAYSSLIREPLDRRTAEIALQDIMPSSEDPEISATSIIQQTAEYFELNEDALTGTGKTRAVAHARQLAMYLCRELTDLSLPRIGQFFGGKDHTTVMYAVRKINREINEKRDTYDQIQAITSRIKSKNRS